MESSMNIGQLNISTLLDMTVIDKIRQYFQLPGQRLNIQPNFIIVEVPLTAGFRQFRYKLGERTNQRALETSLSNNDSFVMTHMAIGIYKQTPPATPGAFNYGANATPYYYPDQNFFPAAATATAVSEQQALESIWKGFITAKADQDEVLLRLDNYNFRKAPFSQFNAGFSLPSHAGEQFVPMFIPVLFDGNKQNTFTFEVGSNADTQQINGAVAGQNNILQILHFGYIIRDLSESASIQNLKEMGIFA